ncbi:hypothetical protein, partial [Paenibacillus mendelii]|uniref:hypothetical protein n=1 Tax=Paenibacillus mendelii TaxID=206163 RepID=UPI002113CF0A
FKGYDPLRTPIVPRRFSFCKDEINPSTGMLTENFSSMIKEQLPRRQLLLLPLSYWAAYRNFPQIGGV